MIRLKAVTNRGFFLWEKTFFLHACATISEWSSDISSMGKSVQTNKCLTSWNPGIKTTFRGIFFSSIYLLYNARISTVHILRSVNPSFLPETYCFCTERFLLNDCNFYLSHCNLALYIKECCLFFYNEYTMNISQDLLDIK